MIATVLDTAIIILSLGSGVASILLVSGLYNKFQKRFLNTYMYFLILIFIYGVYGMIITFFVRNFVLELEIPHNIAQNLIDFIPYLAFPVIVTAWFLFIKTCSEIAGREVSDKGTFTFFGLVISGIAGYIYYFLKFQVVDNYYLGDFINYSKYGYIGLAVISYIVAYFILFTGVIKVKHRFDRELALKFAFISLLFNFITVFIFYFKEMSIYLQRVDMLMFFAGNIPPVLFIYSYLNKHYNAPIESANQSVKDDMITNYQLSPREWEIVVQICKGYTNSQISEKLFISLQTVKDHVSRIYKKTGVKNRVQLVNKTGMKNNS